MVTDARFDQELGGLESLEPENAPPRGVVFNCPAIGIPGLSNSGRNDLATAFTDKDLDICLGKKIADPIGVQIFTNTTI